MTPSHPERVERVAEAIHAAYRDEEAYQVHKMHAVVIWPPHATDHAERWRAAARAAIKAMEDYP